MSRKEWQLLYKTLASIAQEMEEEAYQYNLRGNQAFEHACRLLNSSSDSIQPKDSEEDYLIFQVKPYFTVRLSPPNLVVASTLQVNNNSHFVPTIIERFPALSFSLLVAQDQNHSLTLPFFFQQFGKLTPSVECTNLSITFTDLSLEEYKLLLFLLKKAIINY